MAILSKACKQDKFPIRQFSKTQLYKYSRSSFKFQSESFLESNSPDILALCDKLNRLWHFYVRDYLPVIQKDSATCMHSFAVYVKEGIPNYFIQCLASFSSINHLLCLYALFLMLFHLTQMRLSQLTHLLMCLSSQSFTLSNHSGSLMTLDHISCVYVKSVDLVAQIFSTK